jgi:hypothetical protein
MAGKIISLAALIVVSVFCLAWRTKEIRSEADLGRDPEIRRLLKASGERVEFSPSSPGQVFGGAIRGLAVARSSVPVTIRRPFLSVKKGPDGSVREVTDGSGRTHHVDAVIRETDAQWDVLVTDRVPQPVSIPLADVRRIWFKKIDPFASLMAVAIPIAAARFIVWLAIASI